jgi:hypothetical protein
VNRSKTLAGLALAVALVPAASAAAAPKAPPEPRPGVIAPDQGVKVVGREARFSGEAKRMARFWVGARLDTHCERVTHVVTSPSLVVDTASTRFRGTTVRLGSTAGKDYCVVSHALREGGAIFLLDAIGIDLDAQGHVPTIDALVGENAESYVALASPDAAPPVGKFGYWSDGMYHYVFAWTAPTSKRRLFVESEGDGVLRTNLFEYETALGFI